VRCFDHCLRVGAIFLCLNVGLFLPGTASAQSGLEQRIADLEAREAIRELIFAYGHALDHRDFIAFSSLFAREQGTWVGGFGSATGHDAIFKLMDETIGHAEEPTVPTTHHVFTNIQIDVDGNKADATTKWIFVGSSASESPEWLFLGHYEDQFVREDGHWVFLHREAFTDIPTQPESENP